MAASGSLETRAVTDGPPATTVWPPLPPSFCMGRDPPWSLARLYLKETSTYSSIKCTEIYVSVVKASSVEHVKKNIVYDS